MSLNVSGAEGYAENAPALIRRWQHLSFADLHRPILGFLPAAPCDVLDIGAGIGTDAAALAAMGHRVVAVEPVNEFRVAGMRLYSSSNNIEWLDDALPELKVLRSRRRRFDLIMLTAVWMHLDDDQRRRAMPHVTDLLRGGGRMIMSLRHGPVPRGRRMFDVSPQETIEQAREQGLRLVLDAQSESVQAANRRAGVTWSRLAFVKGRPGETSGEA